MDSSVTLCSLAMLKVRIDQGGDYLEYLRPYILEILWAKRNEAIDESGVAAELRTAFGLEIPRRTVQVILQRLARERTLARKDGVYQVIRLEQDHAFGTERALAEREINAVVSSLVAYAHQQLDCQLKAEQGTEALLAFLSQFSIPCLKSYLRGNALPVVVRHSNEHVVLVSQFINEVLVQQPDLFNAFMTLVQGHMLANALLCPDLDAVTSAYKDVTFYFDTPLLIEALGLAGEQERGSLLELVDVVRCTVNNGHACLKPPAAVR